MSYINDALRKAQSEKNSRYRNYSDVIRPAPIIRKANAGRKWAIGIMALFIALLSAALAIHFYQGKEKTSDQKQYSAVHSPPAASKNMPLNQKPAISEKKEVPGLNAAAMAVKFYREALAQQRTGNFAEAEKLYKKTLTLNPQNIRALNNIGVIYMSQNKSDQAINAFDRAIAYKDDYVDPYYNLACLYSKMNNKDAALRYLRRAASIKKEIISWARSDEDLKNLQTSPEFKSLMEKRED